MFDFRRSHGWTRHVSCILSLSVHPMSTTDHLHELGCLDILAYGSGFVRIFLVQLVFLVNSRPTFLKKRIGLITDRLLGVLPMTKRVDRYLGARPFTGLAVSALSLLTTTTAMAQN